MSRPALVIPAGAPLPVPPDFAARLAELRVTLPDGAPARLGDFLARLLAANEVMNLTAITDPAEAWSRHVLDGLSLVPELDRLGPRPRVVDLGSGGGVPGLVLAIARPEARFTLVESTQKKATFLTETAAALGLGNVTVSPTRAEALHTSHAHAFDAATARAVGKIEVLVPLAAPLVRADGRLLFIKGEKADEERMAAQRMLMRHRCRHKATTLTPTGRVVVFEVG